MSDRERWIIYPLLFLALGAALRDKLTQSVDVETIRCKQLVVVDSQETPRIVLNSNDAGGLVRVIDTPGELTLALGHIDRISGLLAGVEGGLVQWVQPFVRPIPGEQRSDVPPDEGGEDGDPSEDEN